jgi:hypothetical protein
MDCVMWRVAVVPVLTAGLLAPNPAHAQGVAQVPLHVQLSVGGQRFDYRGPGTCERTRNAFVYELPASRWVVRHTEQNRHVHLVLWRPHRRPGDLIAMTVRIGDRVHRVNTVRTKTRSEALGSGQVTFVPRDGGGTFAVRATSDGGESIAGTITCGTFTEQQGQF